MIYQIFGVQYCKNIHLVLVHNTEYPYLNFNYIKKKKEFINPLYCNIIIIYMYNQFVS